MKRKILVATMTTMLCASLLPFTVNAKRSPYYTTTGTIHNFTYVQTYNNGRIIKGKGYDIYTKNGDIYEVNDPDKAFKENQVVKVKIHNNNTPKDKTDDYIISVKKAK